MDNRETREAECTAEPMPAMAWQRWCSEVLEPAVLVNFDSKDEAQRQISGAIREIAAAAFNAGHRYGFARRTDPTLE
jgi:hypothetical protein